MAGGSSETEERSEEKREVGGGPMYAVYLFADTDKHG